MSDLDIVALTVFGEAEGEPLAGKVAVAHVIQNRRDRDGWPDTLREVCIQPKQFSCWDDPGRLKAMMAADKQGIVYLDCLYAVLGAVLGHIPDPTGGADHYHATSIDTPGWATDMQRTAQLGDHIFYRRV